MGLGGEYCILTRFDTNSSDVVGEGVGEFGGVIKGSEYCSR